MRSASAFRESRNICRLSLASSDIHSALAPTRKAAEQVLQRIRLRDHIWPVILDELLCDGLLDEDSAHSTYFSVVCDQKDKPLLYYDGPEGKWVCSAYGLLRKLRKLQWLVRESCTTGIIDALGPSIDYLSILVTTAREFPINQLVYDQVAAEDLQLFPLVDASVNVIADAIIKERHPWNTAEVFDFYSLAFKPLPEPAMLAYKEFVA